MSSVVPNSFNNNNSNGHLANAAMIGEKPCPTVPPFVVTYFYGSPTGWNAVLVGLLSCVLAIVFLLIFLYHFVCRRRYLSHSSSSSSPVGLVDQNGTPSKTATTTFINDGVKETKPTAHTENEISGSPTKGDFALGMPTIGNGHTNSSNTNGILSNGSTDPSELHLLQHEHH